MAHRAIAVDAGGTKIAAGVVSASGAIGERTRVSTPQVSADAPTEAIVRAVSELGAPADLPLGVGAAGLVDGAGMVRYAPNLPWRDYPLAAELAARLGRTVVVENDANAAAWGEFSAGAAQDATGSAVMLTIGTGIGGGLIVDDKLSRGWSGFGGEFGHIIVSADGRRCPCGNRGCLEAVASGTAIGQTAREWLDAGRVPADSALTRLPEVTGAAVGRAAQGGDATAVEAVAECGRWLGIGMASLVNAIDPEVIVVGGGAAELGDLLLEPAGRAFEQRVIGLSHRRLPEVVRGILGGDAGLVGAGLLALEQQGRFAAPPLA